ncbi:MAG: hypothetical protein KAV82_12030 [Phycisphaerae bacterium]|nr:hypothetical protein [Phycisphaerae bacterium]
MSNKLPAKLTRKQNLATIVAGVVLIGFVGFLLFANYRSQIDLQKTAVDRLQLETEEHATTISHFFTERKDDMRNLAAGRSISVFFENKALGMSMRYGLGASLLSIAERFNRLIEDKRLGDDKIYTRVTFIGEDGQLLVDTDSQDSSHPAVPRNWGLLLTPGVADAAIMTEHGEGGDRLLACVPYFFKNRHAGQIIAWINPRIITGHLLRMDASVGRFDTLVCPRNHPYLLDETRTRCSSSLPDLANVQAGMPLMFESVWQDGNKTSLLAARTPVKGSSLSLIHVVPSSQVLGRTAPWHLLAAMAALSAVVLGGVALGFRINTRNLVLQTRLDETSRRQQEVEAINRKLHQEIAERKQAQKELAKHRDHLEKLVKERTVKLEKTHKELLEVSRHAGMAEIATGVLHNVGNVLNSVNVSATVVVDKLRDSRAPFVSKVADLMREHADDLGTFITTDKKGKQLPGYLGNLAEHLVEEQVATLAELESLTQSIERVKEIVRTQQEYAGWSGVVESVSLTELADAALEMSAASFDQHEIEVVRDYADVAPIAVEKQKTLQILLNLVKNARDALLQQGGSGLCLRVRVAPGGKGRIRTEVFDNGVGIGRENLQRIFSHGFTTKKDGHGFGLHSSALTAKELGGSLVADSDGPGKGATFTLELPISRAEATQ